MLKKMGGEIKMIEEKTLIAFFEALNRILYELESIQQALSDINERD